MSPPSVICDLYSRTHADILSAAAQLTGEELHRSFGPRAPSVAFHASHVARRADRVYEILGLTLARTDEERAAVQQTWDEYGLAEKWGLIGANLGRYGTGMEMTGEDAAGLVLPERGELLDYVSMSFAGADKLVEGLREEQLRMSRYRAGENGREMTVAEYLGSYLRHDNRHLGMIEALKGVMGLRGTATR